MTQSTNNTAELLTTSVTRTEAETAACAQCQQPVTLANCLYRCPNCGFKKSCSFE